MSDHTTVSAYRKGVTPENISLVSLQRVCDRQWMGAAERGQIVHSLFRGRLKQKKLKWVAE